MLNSDRLNFGRRGQEVRSASKDWNIASILKILRSESNSLLELLTGNRKENPSDASGQNPPDTDIQNTFATEASDLNKASDPNKKIPSGSDAANSISLG